MRSRADATIDTNTTPRWWSLPWPLCFVGLYGVTWIALGVFGVELTTLISLAVLAPFLIIMSQTDLVIQQIPDWCTATVVALGLAVATLSGQLWINVLTSASVLLVLWSATEFYWKKFGHEALGLGDVKLIAACAIWLGPLELCAMIFLASSGGVIATVVGRAIRRQSQVEEVPFAPFLAYGFFLMVGIGASTQFGSSLI